MHVLAKIALFLLMSLSIFSNTFSQKYNIHQFIFNNKLFYCKGSITISDSLIEIEDSKSKKYQNLVRSYKYVLVSETIDSVSTKGAMIKVKSMKSVDSEIPKEFTLTEGIQTPIFKHYIMFVERTFYKSQSNDSRFDKVTEIIYLIKPV